MGFNDIYSAGSSASGARFWKASDFVSATAILIEVKEYKANVLKAKPSVFIDKATGQPKTITHENQAICDITVFDEPADLVAGNGTEYLNVKINQTILANDLEAEVDKALVKRLQALPSGALVWRPVEPDVVKQVGEYYDAREAKRNVVAEAVSAAGDELPSWAQ